MNDTKPLQNAFDITYGRVSVHIPTHKPRKMKNAVYIVKFFLPDWRPSYSYSDTHLSYEVGNIYYKIYNPQQLKFKLSELENYIRHWHRLESNEQVFAFQVVSP